MICIVEKGESGSAGGGEAQHPSQKDSGREDEKADAKRGVLEKKRGGGALENGDAVRFTKSSKSKFEHLKRPN